MTYIQDRDPAAKVILRGWIVSACQPTNIGMDPQMRIYARNMGAFESRRQGR